MDCTLRATEECATTRDGEMKITGAGGGGGGGRAEGNRACCLSYKLLSDCRIPSHFMLHDHFIYMHRCALKNKVYNNSPYTYLMRCNAKYNKWPGIL